MSPNLQYRVEVPGGWWSEGARVRHAELRPLTGRDEAFLLDAGESLTAAARTTALLCRCLLRLGTVADVTPDDVRALAVGDREALLLQLWRITFGERFPCVITCPGNGCGEKMDLQLKVSDLLLAPYSEPQPWREVTVQAHGEDYLARLRAPNGLDQELAAECGRTDMQQAENLLLRRCAAPLSAVNSESLSAEEWSHELTDRLVEKMSGLDPQADILLQLRCVACDQAFQAEFDMGNYLYRTLRGQIPYLYREVHYIARAYHWTEDEILSMTPRKRSTYLNLLAEEEAH